MRLALILPVAWSATVVLTASVTVDKQANFTKSRDALLELTNYGKEKKLDAHALRFVQQALAQFEKLVAAKKEAVKSHGAGGEPTFTTGMYKVKGLTKLKPKQEKIEVSKDLADVSAHVLGTTEKGPLVVRGHVAKNWDRHRKHWTLDRLMNDAWLKKNFAMEHWDPEKPRTIGEKPDEETLKRYAHKCFFSDKMQVRIPGTQTEHCQRTANAELMVKSASELDGLSVLVQEQMAGVSKGLHAWAQNASTVLKKLPADSRTRASTRLKSLAKYQEFVFGPTGSGINLNTGIEGYYDLLIHGERRWFIGKTPDLQGLAEKAGKSDGFTFEQMSAYMFFEDKFTELQEEYGFDMFVEVNQMPGDIVVIPFGYSTVSMSLLDSISYQETVPANPVDWFVRSIFNPNMMVWTAAFCMTGKELMTLPIPQAAEQVKKMNMNLAMAAPEWWVTVGLCQSMLEQNLHEEVVATKPQVCGPTAETCAQYLAKEQMDPFKGSGKAAAKEKKKKAKKGGDL